MLVYGQGFFKKLIKIIIIIKKTHNVPSYE